ASLLATKTAPMSLNGRVRYMMMRSPERIPELPFHVSKPLVSSLARSSLFRPSTMVSQTFRSGCARFFCIVPPRHVDVCELLRLDGLLQLGQVFARRHRGQRLGIAAQRDLQMGELAPELSTLRVRLKTASQRAPMPSGGERPDHLI